MTDFHSPDGPLPHVPDDLTLAQFILDYKHSIKPVRPDGVPWLIEDASGQELTYEQLRTRTYGLANAIHSKWNFAEDDVACIYSPNDLDYPVVIWAIHRLSGAVSTANPTYNVQELQYQLTTVKTTLLFAHHAVAEAALQASKLAGIPSDRVIIFGSGAKARNLPNVTLQELINEGLANGPSFRERQLAPGEAKTKLAFLCFSSGTTGKPKAVSIPHFAVVANIIQQAVSNKINDPSIPWNERRYRPGDKVSGMLPLFHIYGLVANLHLMLFAGVSVVVMPNPNFELLLKSIARYNIIHLFLVPPTIVNLCKQPIVKNYDLSHIRSCFSAAAPLSVELTHQLARVLPNAISIGQGFGTTETSPGISIMPTSQRLGNGSVGMLLPGITARILKQDGTLGRAGESGELLISGPNVALGYANSEQATKETFVNGWVHTGDEVTISDAGELRIIDRLKELIKVRGFQVAPAELEGHLLDHKSVVDVCVVPFPDDYSGEVPLAFVVPHENLAENLQHGGEEAKLKAELIKYVADHKTKYKWLAGGVEFVNEIPKTASGKLLRRVLRDRARLIRGNAVSGSGTKSKL